MSETKNEKKNLAETVMEHFKEFSEIFPRRSAKESAAAEFLVEFVKKKLNPETHTGVEIIYEPKTVDGKQINNVIVKKPGTTGREEELPIILQAHMDMVCAKGNDVSHDFDTEGIAFSEPFAEDGVEWIKSDKETTLGADDGIGVACIMAVLESTPEQLSHPPIEAVFTSDEEAEMSGAANLDVSKLTAKRMINIDTEQEGMFFYGCAGGINTTVKLPINDRIVPSKRPAYFSLSVSGLLGGHSGLMIGERRANANRLMGRLLDSLSRKLKLYLHDINGGEFQNSIPTDCKALIAVDRDCAETAQKIVGKMFEDFKSEYKGTDAKIAPDRKFKVKLTPTEPNSVDPLPAMTQDTLDKLITILMTVPNDVIAMHSEIEDLVETSSNMGIIRTDDENVSISCFSRSCFESKKDMVSRQVELIAKSVGATVERSANFPAWKPNENSRMRRVMEQVYEKVFEEKIKEDPSKKPVTRSIHAGLECGYFVEKVDGIDCIAIGPTIIGAHTVKEKLQLSTVDDIITLLTSVLEEKIDDSKFDETVNSEETAAVSHSKHNHFNCNCMR